MGMDVQRVKSRNVGAQGGAARPKGAVGPLGFVGLCPMFSTPCLVVVVARRGEIFMLRRILVPFKFCGSLGTRIKALLTCTCGWAMNPNGAQLRRSRSSR